MSSKLNEIPFQLIDVGALGGFHPKWQKFNNAKCFGFEPDSRSLNSQMSGVLSENSQPKSEAQKWSRENWFNIGVFGKPGTYDFYQLREPCNSSLLTPNLEVLSRLSYELRDFEVEKKSKIGCDNLDNICAKHGLSPDAVKLDTQGTEFEILEYSKMILTEHLFFVELEVEFLPLYKNQKLFSDVDSLLRSNGFELLDLGNQLYVKGRGTENTPLRKGYLVSADAIYIKKPETILMNADKLSAEKLLAILPICSAHGYLNIAKDIFLKLREKSPAKYKEVSDQFGDVLGLIDENLPQKPWWTISERKFAKVKRYFERRIRPNNANWNYGIGNPT